MSYTAPDLADDAASLVERMGYSIEEGSEGYRAFRSDAPAGLRYIAEWRSDWNGAVMDALEHMGARLSRAAAPEPEPEPEPAPAETDEQRLERVFQEAIAKSNEGNVTDLCNAIRAGYDAGHAGLDDDMVPLMIELGDQAEAIVTLAQAANDMLDALNSNTAPYVMHEKCDQLREALRYFVRPQQQTS
jgi:hypothetical protein